MGTIQRKGNTNVPMNIFRLVCVYGFTENACTCTVNSCSRNAAFASSEQALTK